MSNDISRRELLKRAAVAGATAIVPPVTGAAPAAAATPTAAAPLREPLETLTAAEADVLEAVVARLIPTDANGPGAAEARAAHYIDRALGGFLAPLRETYAGGLAALDKYARSAKGEEFTKLSPADQDAVLKSVEQGEAAGFPGSAGFFALLREHTIQGTFCDPFYGGNANFVGWDLLGYPGVRMMVTPAEQRITVLKPNHKSAYDYANFTKASASVAPRGAVPGDAHHGD